MRALMCYGPPGTGKTAFLSEKTGELATRYQADEIFVCSFTRAAAHEIASRVSETAVHAENMGTVHALCYRHLGHPEIAEAHLRDWNAQYGRIWPLQGVNNGKDVGGKLDEPDYEPAAHTILDELNVYRARIEPQYIPYKEREFESCWKRWKQKNGYLDFTDLLEQAPEALPGARALVVDELQDCTRLQLRVLRQWAEHCDVYVTAGDDDQMLYSFLGARYEDFMKSLPAAQVTVLSRSYRVPRAVHAYASGWIRQLGNRRYPKEYAPRDADGKLVHAAGLTIENVLPLVERIEQAQAAGSVMVLTSCAYMLQPLLEALCEHGIPFHNPYRRRRRDWNPLFATGIARRVLAFWRLHTLFNEHLAGRVGVAALDADAAWTDPKVWLQWLGMLRAKGTLVHGTKTWLEQQCKTRARIDPLNDLLVESRLHPSTIHMLGAGDLRWLSDNVLANMKQHIVYAASILARRGPQALEQQPKVIVGTIHSVKGGEADTVFLAPDISHTAGKHMYQNGFEGMDALTRTFYVGMTRARECLVLLQPASGWCVNWR